VAPDHRSRAVGHGRVVYDEHLDRTKLLPDDGLECAFEIVGALPRADGNGNRRGRRPAQAALVVRLAAQQARRSGGTDDFVITREFDRVASHEQKVALIDALFTVSSVDASIVTVEDNEIRRIANELKIEHGEYIGVRARHLESLQVLKPKEKK